MFRLSFLFCALLILSTRADQNNQRMSKQIKVLGDETSGIYLDGPYAADNAFTSSGVIFAGYLAALSQAPRIKAAVDAVLATQTTAAPRQGGGARCYSCLLDRRAPCPSTCNGIVHNIFGTLKEKWAAMTDGVQDASLRSSDTSSLDPYVFYDDYNYGY